MATAANILEGSDVYADNGIIHAVVRDMFTTWTSTMIAKQEENCHEQSPDTERNSRHEPRFMVEQIESRTIFTVNNCPLAHFFLTAKRLTNILEYKLFITRVIRHNSYVAWRLVEIFTHSESRL